MLAYFMFVIIMSPLVLCLFFLLFFNRFSNCLFSVEVHVLFRPIFAYLYFFILFSYFFHTDTILFYFLFFSFVLFFSCAYIAYK